MKFETVWVADLGAEFTVSDGKPEPAGAPDSRAWRQWASRNFTGTLDAKGGAAPDRWVRLGYQVNADSRIGWTFKESGGHTFYSSSLAAAGLAQFERELLEQIDADAAARVNPLDALLLYAKWQEVRDVQAIGLAAVAALSPAARAARFPFLVATNNERTDLNQLEVLELFETQTTGKMAHAARIEARRQNVKRLIQSATTQAEKEDIFVGAWVGI